MDKYKRSIFLKNELKRKLLVSIKRSKNVPYIKRYQASYLLSTLPKLSSTNHAVNRCVISGRVWSVNKKTRYSRFILRSESYKSNIPGCSRASW